MRPIAVDDEGKVWAVDVAPPELIAASGTEAWAGGSMAELAEHLANRMKILNAITPSIDDIDPVALEQAIANLRNAAVGEE
jgi:hypothetical protein